MNMSAFQHFRAEQISTIILFTLNELFNLTIQRRTGNVSPRLKLPLIFIVMIDCVRMRK